MKNIVKSIVMLGVLAVLFTASGVKSSPQPARHSVCPTIHTMVADGDIGDGTSPSKKG